jgi:hypothetical protein
MRRGIPDAAPPLIVNLRRRDVLVIQEVLYGYDRLSRIEQQRSRRCTEGTAITGGNAGTFPSSDIGTGSVSHFPVKNCTLLPITEFIGGGNLEQKHLSVTAY